MAIDINSVSQEDLVAVINVGEEIADAIIRARPFESIEDLIFIPGIGPRTLERLKAQGVTITGVAPTSEEAVDQVSEGQTGMEENVVEQQIHHVETSGYSTGQEEIGNVESSSRDETDQLSEGLAGTEEESGKLHFYVEAPRGFADTIQEVEGFDQEVISEYTDRTGNTLTTEK